MKTSVSQKIKIGVFTIAGILLFVAGIFLIGSKKNMFDDTFMIYGTFRNVGGLEVGNNIQFAGINVGTVKDIRIVSDTMIRIDMSMKSQVKPFLKADALAAIGSDGLMGDKLITIASGSANEVKLLTAGSRIMTVDPVDYDKVIAKFIKVASNAEIITQELAGMAVHIREGNGSISRLLYTNNLSKSLEGTASNAERITGSLAGIASQVRAGNGSIGNLIYTDSLSKDLESAATTANAAMLTIGNAASTANAAMLTIEDGAYGFSENMKALQGNFFLRGYFKRKALQEEKNRVAPKVVVTSEVIDSDMDENELKEIILEAQKALDAKRGKN